MTKEQLQGVRRRFLEFASGFISTAGDMRHMMELKREHCAFVARNCRDLARGEGWTAADIHAAEALGVLHDIGRFPQLEEYGTFLDAQSIDHGKRGWQAVQESGVLDSVEPALKGALLDGVRYHNARLIPTDLPAGHLRWVNLIRDADRLDIYRVVLDAIETGQLEEHPEIGLGLTRDGGASPETVTAISQGHLPAYSELKTFADFLLLLLSWIDLCEYDMTLKLIGERQVVDRISRHLPQEESVLELVDQFRAKVLTAYTP